MGLEMKASWLSFCLPRRFRLFAARCIGDLAYLIDDLPKKTVWRMNGDLSIMFVGDQTSSQELLPLFFDEPGDHEFVGQTWPFRLGRKTQSWLEEGTDLVICQLSRLHWYRSRAPFKFTIPQMVCQVLPFPGAPDELLAGTRSRDVRRRVNHLKKSGYDWHFSRSRADYDFFYERLYLPFVRARHGEAADITAYPWHWDMFIQKAGGGMVLVTHEGSIVAGSVCLIVDNVCYGVELGVLDGDPQLYQKGIYAFMVWATASWAMQQGAGFQDLGMSLSLRTNKIFHWKAKLGSQVTRNKYTNRVLAFSAGRMTPELKKRLNEIGFICEVDQRYYGLVIDGASDATKERRPQESIQHAQKDGLSGVCIVAAGMQPQPYE